MKSFPFVFIRIAFVLLPLVGCAVGGDVRQNYILPIPQTEAQSQPLSRSLKVMPVTAAPGLDSTRIALVENDVRMNYLAEAKWAEPLPQMLQFLWVRALKQNGLAASVGSDSDDAHADRLIYITARAFNAVRSDNGGIVVRISYEAKVVAPITHAVLAVEDSDVEERAASSSMDDVMQTFGTANAKAVHGVLKKLSADLKG